MRSLVVAVVALALSTTMGLVQAQEKMPFSASINGLATYLELEPYQMNEVNDINDYFIQMQSESLQGNPARKEKKMQYAMLGNLKLMKEALTADQYRKYVQLLNVTNNNNRLLSEDVVLSDVYLAEKK